MSEVSNFAPAEHPDPGAKFNTEGGKLFKAGDYGGAAKCYQRAIAENDTVSTYFANLAAADLRLGMYPAAQDAAQRALILDPRSVKARYRRAMARKGLNLIPEALVDIAGVLTADPGNSQARTELAILVEIQCMAGRRPLEPEQILAANFPHAYGSTSNPPVRNPSDPHQMLLPFFYKAYPDEVPTIATINPGVVPSGCIACKVIKDKKDLKTCQKCRRAEYCNVECQRAHWPSHKLTCNPAKEKGITMKVGRNIQNKQFFDLHLLFYAIRAMGPPQLPNGNHDLLLMVVLDLVPISAPSDSGKYRRHISVKNLLPVPICIIPQEVVDMHRAVVALASPHNPVHAIWITTSGVYDPAEENRSRLGVLPVKPFILENIWKPEFTLDLYSHSYRLFRRITPDLDFLFTSINDELRLDTHNHYLLRA
ncbi:hypothetical protein B0H16DRAFT_1616786 [Mycena metata]|uniref:MYND-type domain-containing protein n=1 Tax=Mycena metata TaxID=1033252 RepID=A0AAD7H8R2_9AGAR|nr:hypothetical protein B0H16DRAFT_1616786 [Mycena metata]